MDKKLASLAAVIATATISARAVNYMIQSTTPLLAKSMGFSALKIGLLALVASAFQLVGSGYLNVVLGPAARKTSKELMPRAATIYTQAEAMKISQVDLTAEEGAQVLACLSEWGEAGFVRVNGYCGKFRRVIRADHKTASFSEFCPHASIP